MRPSAPINTQPARTASLTTMRVLAIAQGFM
jgi:hypothetical protein